MDFSNIKEIHFKFYITHNSCIPFSLYKTQSQNTETNPTAPILEPLCHFYFPLFPIR